MQNFRVEGASMEPNLHSGQYILINKAAYWLHEPGRGDIVVYNSPQTGKRIIHRIVGMPGEEVEMIAGKVYIDGNELNEPYAHGNSTSFEKEKVPSDCYFIVGDNRNGTKREMVPQGNIVGKSWLIIWPLGDLGLAPNYSHYSYGVAWELLIPTFTFRMP